MTRLETAALGLRSLFELAQHDDHFDDLIEAAEAALAMVGEDAK
ncbi:hypothetical protein [Sphingomonas sp. Leaf242]|nr:hypothetical protein [Sphingomonas sp. Leaf242]